MTDTDLMTAATGNGAPGGKLDNALTSMLLPELKALAGQVGVKGTSGMRKGDLIARFQHHTGSQPGWLPGGQGHPAVIPDELCGSRG